MENNGDEDDYDDNDTLKRLRLTFTPNGKREFAPRDQDSPLIVVYCLLLLPQNK